MRLSMACLRLGLPAHYGRGYDELPADVRAGLADAFVRSPDRVESLRALRSAVAGLLREGAAVGGRAAKVEPRLREFIFV